jgi:predicted permease
MSAVGFGTVPAWFGSRLAPAAALTESGRATSGHAQGRMRAGLVIAETGIGIVLLIAAGLLIRSFSRLAHTNPGFETTHAMTAKFNLPDSRYPYRRQIAFYDELLDDLNRLPGVEATAVAPLPLSGSRYGVSFELPGAPMPASRRPNADFGLVGPGYFHAMRIHVVSGREFRGADNDAAPRVVVVNESFARQFLSGRSAVGQRIRPGLSTTEKEAPWREVVGVVSDFRQRAVGEAARPAYFVPYAQGLISTPYLVIRTSAPPSLVVGQVRDTLLHKDRELALYDVRPLSEYVDESLASARFQTLLLTLFASLALVLTAIGLYGVVAYGVVQRTREFGIRLALGARPQQVRRLVLGQAMLMAAAGVLCGIVGALFTTRLLGTALYDVHPFDPAIFATVVGMLFAVALGASYIPARRATRVDPMLALRAE